MSTITAKIRLYPDKSQEEAMISTLKTVKLALNVVSQTVFDYKELRQPILHQYTYTMLRTDYGLRSQMAQSVVKTVIAKYRSAKSNGHDWSLVCFKQPDCDLVWNRDYSFVKGQLSINSLFGRLKMPHTTTGFESYFDGSWTYGTAKLVHKHGKFFLHVPMTKEIPVVTFSQIQNVIGVDLGIRHTAVAYDSAYKTTFFRGSATKQRRAHFKKLRQELQRHQTPSARRRLKRVGQRENRWMSDVNHRISKALVTQAGSNSMIVLEDLTNVRTATERIRLKDRYVSVSWAFYQLRMMIEYKAALAGIQTTAVNPRYTSQSCPNCGHTSKENRDKKSHLFTCQNCGYRSNDDRIGAMNLRQKGIEYIVAGAVE